MLEVSDAGAGRPATRTFFLDAWGRAVTKSPSVVCGIEAEFQCRGFDAGECTGCAEAGLESSATCDRTRCAACGAGGRRMGCVLHLLLDELAVKARPVGITATTTTVAVMAELVMFLLSRVVAG
eukprot:TRINITY_DN4921_c0_g1_i3.p1 TRINITY_DN4921_c0_g1~~TRINITY_DN4921_c0_g1_i3.p1  ORF type:complete len:145 (-),score=16.29 TRINITY_DN4921_c0_g1_i3:276-647(-)